MTEYTLGVNGMNCTGCENMVRKELNPIPGIKDAEADHTSDEVIVYGDQDTKSRARQAIADLGYEPE